MPGLIEPALITFHSVSMFKRGREGLSRTGFYFLTCIFSAKEHKNSFTKNQYFFFFFPIKFPFKSLFINNVHLKNHPNSHKNQKDHSVVSGCPRNQAPKRPQVPACVKSYRKVAQRHEIFPQFFNKRFGT